LRSNEDLDASGDAWLAANEAVSFERHDHLVDRGRADLKVALHIGLGGRVSEHVRDAKYSSRSAVGTVIADRPPPKSVQAEFPHTAPTLGA
jgi:hypothetical protein